MGVAGRRTGGGGGGALLALAASAGAGGAARLLERDLEPEPEPAAGGAARGRGGGLGLVAVLGGWAAFGLWVAASPAAVGGAGLAASLPRVGARASIAAGIAC